MSPLRRRLLVLVLALATVAAIPPTATAAGDDCRNFRASSVPVVHPAVNVGRFQVCDEDDDEAPDTVRFDTDRVHADGVVSVTSEESRRSDHTDDRTEAEARVTPSAPTGPIVYQRVQVEDEGDDGRVDRVNSEGGVYSNTRDVRYFAALVDVDDDGELDGYGLIVCGTDAACVAPDPRMVPEVPERVDLPDLVFRIEPVGWVP